jgi:hypothetical protein
MNIDDWYAGLSTKQLVIGLCVSLSIGGIVAGTIIGEYLQGASINAIINSSAQPGHIIQNEYGYFTVQRYNESCVTVVCVSDAMNITIPNRSDT